MNAFRHLGGVYAAVVTPLSHTTANFIPEDLPPLLAYLAQRGCHGALILGTTGEGPSFSTEERQKIYQTASLVRQEFSEFRLFAGTGTPSLEETITLTRSAFDAGYDGVVVLPPYFYRKASMQGFYNWYSTLIERAVPAGNALLAYHIPAMSGVTLTIELVTRLQEKYPHQFAGLKDSSSDRDFARQLGERCGDDLLIFSGNDALFTHALQHYAAGCITALANIASPDLRQIWDAQLMGLEDNTAQERLIHRRRVLDSYTPAPPLIKALLHHQHGFPAWHVRSPLIPLEHHLTRNAIQEMEAFPATP